MLLFYYIAPDCNHAYSYNVLRNFNLALTKHIYCIVPNKSKLSRISHYKYWETTASMFLIFQSCTVCNLWNNIVYGVYCTLYLLLFNMWIYRDKCFLYNRSMLWYNRTILCRNIFISFKINYLPENMWLFTYIIQQFTQNATIGPIYIYILILIKWYISCPLWLWLEF